MGQTCPLPRTVDFAVMDLVTNLPKISISSLLLLAGLAVSPAAAQAEWPELISTNYFQSEEQSAEEVVYRGQSDPFYPAPNAGPTYPVNAGIAQPGPVVSGDPFVGGQFAPPPASFDPFGPQQVYGINGPQPFRFGWKEQLEWAITPQVGTSPNVGKLFNSNEFVYVD